MIGHHSRLAAALLAGFAAMVGSGGAAAELVLGPAPQGVVDRMVPVPPGVTLNTWTAGLEVPWSLVFLPDGRALVSERRGRIRLIEADGRLRPEPYAIVDVAAIGEGGLLGIALHPAYPAQPYIYAYRTFSGPRGRVNQVIRLIDYGGAAELEGVILDGIPAADYHNGGRIAFGPDGMLYVGTGDNFQSHLAQALTSLAGKVLRIAPDGSVPPGNPFGGSPIWSYGSRNVQGFAWHPVTGAMFETEHGPTGEIDRVNAHDEVNVIRPGFNYGWPLVVGAPAAPGLTDPLISWTDYATPPSGFTFWQGELFIATLRSQALIRVQIDTLPGGGYAVRGIERWFARDHDHGAYGRLRDAVVGPDGALYVLTNDRPDGDIILRVAR